MNNPVNRISISMSCSRKERMTGNNFVKLIISIWWLHLCQENSRKLLPLRLPSGTDDLSAQKRQKTVPLFAARWCSLCNFLIQSKPKQLRKTTRNATIMRIFTKPSKSHRESPNQLYQHHWYFHFYIWKRANTCKYSRFWRNSRGQKEGKDALVFWKLSSLFDESSYLCKTVPS